MTHTQEEKHELTPFGINDLDRFARTASGPFSTRQLGVLRGVPAFRVSCWYNIGSFTGLFYLCSCLAEDFTSHVEPRLTRSAGGMLVTRHSTEAN